MAGLLVVAFLLGGGSAEVAVRTHRAVEAARSDRELGAAGQLIALELSDPGGDVLARPRLVAPSGKRVEVVLHDPERPADVRVAFRVDAFRDPSGEITVEYALWIPDRAIAARGTLSLTPGVEQAIRIGDGGGSVVATWLAVPVPSRMFEAYLEAERSRDGTLSI